MSIRDVHEFSVGGILIIRKRLTKNIGRDGIDSFQNGADATLRLILSKIRTAGRRPEERTPRGGRRDCQAR
jgi:hypothetical protein